MVKLQEDALATKRQSEAAAMAAETAEVHRQRLNSAEQKLEVSSALAAKLQEDQAAATILLGEAEAKRTALAAEAEEVEAQRLEAEAAALETGDRLAETEATRKKVRRY